MKKTLVLTLIITISITLLSPLCTTAANSSNYTGIKPYWTWLDIVESYLDISDSGLADVYVKAIAIHADRIKIVASLQRFNNGYWTELKSWTEDEDKPGVMLEGIWQVNRRYSYRLYSTIYLYSDGELKETVTDINNYGYFE